MSVSITAGRAGSRTVRPPTPLEAWTAAITANVRLPSAALQNVTVAFQTYEADKSQTNLTNLATQLRVWRTSGNLVERTVMVGAADNLSALIAKAEKTNIVINRTAQDIGTNDLYELVVPVPGWAIAAGGGAVPPDQDLPPLKPGEVMKINEAFSRARAAARNARDKLSGLSPKASTISQPAVGPVRNYGTVTRAVTVTPSPGSLLTQCYERFFGAWDQSRFTKVLSGFEAICDGFDTKIQLMDIRNTVDGARWFAACVNARITRDGDRRVTSNVLMVMGRAFFTGSVPKRGQGTDFNGQEAFSVTSDATMGTMVHELAHGTFAAIDAPRIDSTGNWPLGAPLSMDPTSADYGKSPDAGNNQSSTTERDEYLARFFPDMAVLNADNYGQFARAVEQL